MVTGYIVEGIRIVATGNSDFEKWSFIGYMVGQFFVGINVETLQDLPQGPLVEPCLPGLRLHRLHPLLEAAAHRDLAGQPVHGHPEARGPARAHPRLRERRELRRGQARGVHLEADLRQRCLHALRPLPERLPGLPDGQGALAQEAGPGHQGPLAGRARRSSAAGRTRPPRRPGPRRARRPRFPRARRSLINDAVGVNPVWDCTNCMHCMEHCPVLIEHVPKIVDMRRYKVLTEADFAPELQLTYRNMENNSNPWGIGAHMRGDWAKELGVKTMAENPEAEYLCYVGCAGVLRRPGQEGLRGLREDPRRRRASASPSSAPRRAAAAIRPCGAATSTSTRRSPRPTSRS
ncbi:MAG: (Fe-S)-binding protein [Desulfobacterales bacterium]|nr:(Fe-S)-binding protein [Desulfobacterales bacterium]